MPEFKKVSVKMAKTQGLSLNPGKISGLCGRLMCCLGYEIEHYTDAAKKLPKIGSEVTTPEGKASVASLNMLKMEVRVKADDGAGGWVFRDYPVSELKFKKFALSSNEKVTDDDDKDTL